MSCQEVVSDPVLYSIILELEEKGERWEKQVFVVQKRSNRTRGINLGPDSRAVSWPGEL